MRKSLKHLSSVAGALILIAVSLQSIKDDDSQSEVLRNILDNFRQEELYRYSSSFDPETQQLTIVEKDRLSGTILRTLETYNNLPNLTLEYSVFWLEVSNNEINLNLFNPVDELTYQFDISNSDLNLNTEQRLFLTGYLDGNDLTGMYAQIYTEDNLLSGTLYLDLEKLEVTSYYDFTELTKDFNEQFGENSALLSAAIRPNGLVYVDGVASNSGASVLTIIDTTSGIYKFYEGMTFRGIFEFNDSEVLAYQFFDNGVRFFGLRDLTNNTDIFLSQINGAINYSNYENIISINNFINDGTNTKNILSWVYFDGATWVTEEWTFEGIMVTLNFSELLANNNTFSISLIHQTLPQLGLDNIRLTGTTPKEQLDEIYIQVYDLLSESGYGVDFERRENANLIVDEQIRLGEVR